MLNHSKQFFVRLASINLIFVCMLSMADNKADININNKSDFKSCDDTVLSKYKDNIRKNLEELKSLRIKMGCIISPETDLVINEFFCKMSRASETKGCPSNMEDPQYIRNLQSKMQDLLAKDRERSGSFTARIKNLYEYYFTNSCTLPKIGTNCDLYKNNKNR